MLRFLTKQRYELSETEYGKKETLQTAIVDIMPLF